MRTLSRSVARIALSAAALLLTAPVVGQTPEQEAQWLAERARMQAEEKAKSEQLQKQREARKTDPMAWVRTLDPMSLGGWEFRTVAGDGSWAAFSTLHQMKTSGRIVTVWLRQEYAEPQRGAGGDNYLSEVEQAQFDCAKELDRAVLVIFYSESNLKGVEQRVEGDAKKTAWNAIVPGTLEESEITWACGKATASK